MKSWVLHMHTINQSNCRSRLKKISGVFLALANMMMVGCAATNKGTPNQAKTIDPYENINRKIFSFNDNVDDYVAPPMRANAFDFFNYQIINQLCVYTAFWGSFYPL
jgi:phospholipid-binding lipoprotein MlaA